VNVFRIGFSSIFRACGVDTVGVGGRMICFCVVCTVFGCFGGVVGMVGGIGFIGVEYVRVSGGVDCFFILSCMLIRSFTRLGLLPTSTFGTALLKFFCGEGFGGAIICWFVLLECSVFIGERFTTGFGIVGAVDVETV
jgi:hypothetical protein